MIGLLDDSADAEKACVDAQLIGQGQAYRMLMGARLVAPAEALQLGLIDRVVPKDQLLPAAEAAMKAALKYPDGGRQATKAALRKDLAAGWGQLDFVQKEATTSWDNLSKPMTVEFLGGIMKSLESKGKPARPKL